MQRSFGGPVLEQNERRDREVTLGPVLMSVLGLGLVALCAVCFVSGYAVGHSASPDQPFSSAPRGGPSAAQLFEAQPKPAATPGTSQPHAEVAVDSAAPESAESANAESADAASPDGQAPANQAAVVQAALPAQNAASLSTATPQQGANTWMVQIAAVSNAEDANVLLSALRKRGYSVSARHDPIDNLMHVQVGPFASHNDASSMRQKLLNDGYNAVIQP